MGKCHPGDRQKGLIMRQPKISIIAVNFHQPEVTIELLESLKNINAYSNLEVVLVDLEQSSDSAKKYHGVYPELIYLPVNSNPGFAGANNIGRNQASGEMLFFLNNDTVVTANLLSTLVQVLLNNPEIGIVSPVIRYHSEPEKIQFAGAEEISLKTGRNYTHQQVPEGSETDWRSSAFIHGAAMMISASLFDQLGSFNESYFLYYEEYDLAMKAKIAGKKLALATEAEVFHKASVSTGRNSPLRTYYMNRNRIQFIRNFANRLEFIYFSLFFSCVAMPKQLLTFFWQRDFKNIIGLFRAWFDGVTLKTGKSF